MYARVYIAKEPADCCLAYCAGSCTGAYILRQHQVASWKSKTRKGASCKPGLLSHVGEKSPVK